MNSYEDEYPMAQRTAVKMRTLIYGQTGAGKTLTALAMATQIASVPENIFFLELDNKRALHLAESEPGKGDGFRFRYKPLDKFDVPRIVNELGKVKSLGAEVVIIDSGSRIWQDEGGLLDVRDNHKKEGQASSWGHVNKQERLLYNALDRCGVHYIICCQEAPEYNDDDKIIGVKPRFRDSIEYTVDYIFRCQISDNAGYPQQRYITVEKSISTDLQVDFNSKKVYTEPVIKIGSHITDIATESNLTDLILTQIGSGVDNTEKYRAQFDEYVSQLEEMTVDQLLEEHSRDAIGDKLWPVYMKRDARQKLIEIGKAKKEQGKNQPPAPKKLQSAPVTEAAPPQPVSDEDHTVDTWLSKLSEVTSLEELEEYKKSALELPSEYMEQLKEPVMQLHKQLSEQVSDEESVPV